MTLNAWKHAPSFITPAERKQKMKKQTIAIFFGGPSSEYSVSLESAYSVIKNLNTKEYNVIPIGISRNGDWYYFTGDIENIKSDCWLQPKNCIPAVLSPNRNTGKLLLFYPEAVRQLEIDLAFPVMHGRYGEDGTIQGMITLAGIPLVGCGVLASALCMDKDRAHKLAECAGVAVPKSICINLNYDVKEVNSFGQAVGYPLFVKPVKAGSSYGVTKVSKAEQLIPAIQLAFEYDDAVILEETINGFEVGCAIMGNEELIIGEIDEIELKGGFFDYTEKYTLQTSSIHVPARIHEETAARIKKTAIKLYRVLGCSFFARIDLFLTPDQQIIFNEVNTIPGFTEHSRYPGMMKAAGISFSDILNYVIGLAVKE